MRSLGLKPGDKVLEVGCGTGHMACELANYVGETGKVIAIDSSADQIAMAEKTAKQFDIKNIEFHVCNVFELDELNINYDATYGRWVLEFSQNPQEALRLMLKHLNKGGILTYEASHMKQKTFFSNPENPCIEKWHSYAPKFFTEYGYPLKFAEEVYHVFKKFGCENINMRVNQAVLKTAEEKSVYRLGLITSQTLLSRTQIISEDEMKNLMDELIKFEKSEAISSFYQNILICGKKFQ